MSDPSKFGPPGGPLSGGREAGEDYAYKYNKAAQERQKAVFEARQKLAADLAPKEKGTPEQQPQKERGGPER